MRGSPNYPQRPMTMLEDLPEGARLIGGPHKMKARPGDEHVVRIFELGARIFEVYSFRDKRPRQVYERG